MDAIEAYEKYKHMDETISSPYFRGNNNTPTLLQDLWSAVKAASRPATGVVESISICDYCDREGDIDVCGRCNEYEYFTGRKMRMIANKES